MSIAAPLFKTGDVVSLKGNGKIYGICMEPESDGMVLVKQGLGGVVTSLNTSLIELAGPTKPATKSKETMSTDKTLPFKLGDKIQSNVTSNKGTVTGVEMGIITTWTTKNSHGISWPIVLEDNGDSHKCCNLTLIPMVKPTVQPTAKPTVNAPDELTTKEEYEVGDIVWVKDPVISFYPLGLITSPLQNSLINGVVTPSYGIITGTTEAELSDKAKLSIKKRIHKIYYDILVQPPDIQFTGKSRPEWLEPPKRSDILRERLLSLELT